MVTLYLLNVWPQTGSPKNVGVFALDQSSAANMRASLCSTQLIFFNLVVAQMHLQQQFIFLSVNIGTQRLHTSTTLALDVTLSTLRPAHELSASSLYVAPSYTDIHTETCAGRVHICSEGPQRNISCMNCRMQYITRKRYVAHIPQSLLRMQLAANVAAWHSRHGCFALLRNSSILLGIWRHGCIF